jgi:hypothetical protein
MAHLHVEMVVGDKIRESRYIAAHRILDGDGVRHNRPLNPLLPTRQKWATG